MNSVRAGAAGVMFEGDDQFWWVTGGAYYGINNVNTTELYDRVTKQFTYYSEMPYETDLHNLINVNNTHTVLLGGREVSEGCSV